MLVSYGSLVDHGKRSAKYCAVRNYYFIYIYIFRDGQLYKFSMSERRIVHQHHIFILLPLQLWIHWRPLRNR